MNQGSTYLVELFNPLEYEWNRIQDTVVALEQNAFGSMAVSRGLLKKDFLNPSNVVIVLRDSVSGQLIGFSHAKPIEEPFPERSDEEGTTAIMWNTIIHESLRGKRLVGMMMGKMEEVLRIRGYQYVERYVVIANNYAKNVAKNYDNRIVTQESYFSEQYGPQIFFRIKL